MPTAGSLREYATLLAVKAIRSSDSTAVILGAAAGVLTVRGADTRAAKDAARPSPFALRRGKEDRQGRQARHARAGDDPGFSQPERWGSRGIDSQELRHVSPEFLPEFLLCCNGSTLARFSDGSPAPTGTRTGQPWLDPVFFGDILT